MHCEVHHADGDVVLFRVLCAVGLDFEAGGGFVCSIIYFEDIESL